MTDVPTGRAQDYFVRRLYDVIKDDTTLSLRLIQTLGTAADLDGGTECSGGGYSSISVSGSDFSSAESPPLSLDTPGIANNRTFTFGPGTGSGFTFQGIGLFSGNNCLVVWETGGTCGLNERAVFAVGALRLNINDVDYLV